MLIDSHCHLDFPELEAEREAVLARARAAGIGLMVTISTRVRRFDELLEIVEGHDNVFCSVGTHPHHAAEERDVTLDEILNLARHPKVVAIGEAGLDYHYDHSPRVDQERGFRTHIAAARETGLPLVIHARDADEDVARILEEETKKGAFPFVLHCFTGGPELARRGVALGGTISFSGVITFKNSGALRDIAAASAARPAAGRDRRALSRAGAFAGAYQRACQCGAYRGPPRQHSRCERRGDRPCHHREFRPPFQEGAGLGACRSVHRPMTLTLTILGCGTSGGVPRIGNHWGACDPSNPKNRRRRCSVLVQKAGVEGTTNVLVDTSPDVREQLLDVKVGWLDGVLYTHDHADHCHGIDDLRMVSYNGHRRVAVYYDEETGRSLKQRFAYCFNTPPESEYPPILDSHDMTPGEPVEILGAGGAVEALPFRQRHGAGETLGFRFGGIAYSPDVSDLPDESLDAAAGSRCVDHRCAPLHAASESFQRR